MRAVSLFSKLSTKASDYSLMPFGDSADAVNVALYTKGMYRKAYLAARFIWSKDLSVHDELTEYVIDSTMIVAIRERWDITKCGKRVKTLVNLAMIEHYAPNIFKTNKSRLLYCGIPESQWYKLWGKRYEVPYKVITGYLDIANGSVHK